MKNISLVALILMCLTVVSCGDKEKDKKSGAFSSALSTQTGYLNLQTYALEVGGRSYPASQQNAMVVNQALQLAQQNRIQPIMVNGVQKLRARVTAQVINQYNNQYNQFNNQFNQPQPTQGSLMIQSIQFY